MRLIDAQVLNFRSIEDSGSVGIDPSVTVLVGKNESGKTAFLQALSKSTSPTAGLTFDPVLDYPRRRLLRFQAGDESKVATVLKYELEPSDLARINAFAGFSLVDRLTFSITHLYGGGRNISISLDEKSYLRHILPGSDLTNEVQETADSADSLVELIDLLKSEDLNASETAFLKIQQDRFAKPKAWDTRLDWYVYTQLLSPYVPTFLYFDDYSLLPGKINLKALQAREVAETLDSSDRTALSLLRLAKVELGDLLSEGGYESNRATLEAISNDITDKVFLYWRQNEDLEVTFDVSTDPKDEAPFNEGPNLYIRINNKRHRVTVPFSQRSKGFIWFFSFITWFNSVKTETGSSRELILLLDEPGLSLHAMAQADFLRYIETLADEHQILYTTHSPFMVESNHLERVRTVEDKMAGGTKVTANISTSDPSTIFPLQAALGYTIAQNLFISPRNLLVEGPADLAYLQHFSEALRTSKTAGMNTDVTIVPVGGLDKLATFVALLRGNELELAVLHDYASSPDQRLESLIREKLIEKKSVLHYASFRKSGTGGTLVDSDVEDLMSPSVYLKLFSGAYAAELTGRLPKVSDLPDGDRIVVRLNEWLKAESITLRPSGGFNHYRVAMYLANHPIKASSIDLTTRTNFSNLFSAVNRLFP